MRLIFFLGFIQLEEKNGKMKEKGRKGRKEEKEGKEEKEEQEEKVKGKG